MAVCHAMLRVVYFVLKERVPYIAYVGEEEAQKRRERQIRHHCKRLRDLGAAPDLVQQALAELGVSPPEPKRKGARRIGALKLKAY